MTTTSTSTATTSSTASIVKTLGSGSGLDTGAIIAGLVQAQFAVKNAAFARSADTLTTQISAVAKLKSGITGFDTALKTLVKGGSLASQPTSSASGVVGVAAIGSTRLAGLSAQLTVTHLASAQAATTNTAVSRTAAFRSGSLAITIGGATTAVAIGDGDATLEGIAAKVNAAKLGVTATVVTDAGGARLTFKGATGAVNAFTIAATDDDAGAAGISLGDLAVGGTATGTMIGTTAADAEIALDGATYHRATNNIDDLIPGVRLTLAGIGAATLGAAAPTASISQAVSDFVDTFNELHTTLAGELDPKTGDLRQDSVSQALLRSLGALTTASLANTASGAPRTLADLGVKTNRDGSLAVDTVRLADALQRYPDAAEAMFAPGSGATNGGLSAALSAIATAATDSKYGYDAETVRYQSAATKITDAQSAAADAASAMSDRLTQQFATMDTRVAAYKSTQDFLKQQVDAWNNSNN